jgi:hypothetical protein
VWAAMKEYVAARNKKFNLSEATKYCDEFFKQFSVERRIFYYLIKIAEHKCVEDPQYVTVRLQETRG